MNARTGLSFAAAVALCLVLWHEPGWAFGPRYGLFVTGRVVAVESPNLVRIRAAGGEKVLTLRLLGVGSPRNRDRVRSLDRGIQGFIERNDFWGQSIRCVHELVRDRTVDVWTRKSDPRDEKSRLLAYVMIRRDSAEPLDLNAEIIRQGLGFVTRDYVHVTFAEYRLLEEDARRHRRGMWQALEPDRLSSMKR